ncbi:hypothetical protein BDR05DRAFT_952777 [Suillus weaverae]|nr:hypothetical protein BDR05DRAFT_952777 [Suillus weaverae]
MGPPVSIGNNIPPGPSVIIEDIHNMGPWSAGPSCMGYYSAVEYGLQQAQLQVQVDDHFIPLTPRDVLKVKRFPFICGIFSKSDRRLMMPLRVINSNWSGSGSSSGSNKSSNGNWSDRSSDRSGRDGNSNRSRRNGINSGDSDNNSGSNLGSVLLSRRHVGGGGGEDDPTAELLV